MRSRTAGVAGRLRPLVFGEEDPRVRATWRVLLAMPVLWTLTGAVLAGNAQPTLAAVVPGGLAELPVVTSLLHAGFLVVVLAGWARYLDRRPLSEYGVSPSLGWARRFLAGFLAVVAGQALWVGLGSAAGKTVRFAPSTPEGSVLAWLVLPLVALGLHAAVQQVVFFRVILGTAVEGLRARGVAPRLAAVAALAVTVPLFVAMHGDLPPLRVLDLALAGGVFGLLALHSGDLGLGTGAHFGTFYSGTALFSVVGVTGSLPGVLGVIDGYGFPKMVLAYAVLVGWLRWRHGTVPLQRAAPRRVDPPAPSAPDGG